MSKTTGQPWLQAAEASKPVAPNPNRTTSPSPAPNPEPVGVSASPLKTLTRQDFDETEDQPDDIDDPADEEGRLARKKKPPVVS